jgi:hypothetical protein
VETIKGAIIEGLDGIDALCREHDQELRQVRRYYQRRLVMRARTERTSGRMVPGLPGCWPWRHDQGNG